MSFSKRLIAIIPIVICIIVLLVLGVSDAQVKPKVEKTEDVTFLDKTDTLYFWYSDDSITDYINKVAVSFSELHDVNVLPKLVSDSDYLESINRNSIEQTEMPDLFCISNDSLEKAYLLGLASQIQEDGLVVNETNYSETALSAVTYHDKLIAYPLYYETSALFYNKNYVTDWQAQQENKVLDEAETADENGVAVLTNEQFQDLVSRGVPKTMKEVLGFADYYEAPESVQGVMKWDVTDIFYNYHFAGDHLNVGGITGDDESILHINNEEVVKSLLEYQSLNDIFYIETHDISAQTVLNEFMAGEMVFTIATTDAIATLEAAKEEGTLLFDYGVAQLPKVEHSETVSGLSVTTTVVVNDYSSKKQLANEFASYLVNENYDSLYRRTGKVSTNLGANQDNDKLQTFMDVYQQSTSLPKLIGTSNLWIQLEVMFLKIWSGEDIAEQLQLLEQQIKFQVTGAEN